MRSSSTKRIWLAFSALLVAVSPVCPGQLKEVHEIEIGRIVTNTHGAINARVDKDEGEIRIWATDSNDGTTGFVLLSQDDVRKTISALDEMLTRPDKQWEFKAGVSMDAGAPLCPKRRLFVSSSVQTTLVGVVDTHGRNHDAISVVTNKKKPLEFLALFKAILERGSAAAR